MTVYNSPVLALPYPDGNELVSLGPTDFQNLVAKLDGGASGPTVTRVMTGSLSGRPAPNTVAYGTLYQCSDVSAWFLRDGSMSWRYVQIDGGGAPVGAVHQYVAPSVNGVVADPVDPDGVVRWLVMDGRSANRSQYPSFFGLVGTTFGVGKGDGLTFSIPDGRGRLLVGQGLGTAPDATSRTVGHVEGTETHNHPMPGLSIPGLSIPGLSVPSLSIYVNDHVHNLGSNSGAQISTGIVGNDLYIYANSTGGVQASWGGYTNYPTYGTPNYVTNGYTGLATALIGNTDGSGVVGGSTGTGTTGGGTTGGGTTGGGTTGGASNMPPTLTVSHIVRVL